MRKHIHHIHIFILIGLIILIILGLWTNSYIENLNSQKKVTFGVSFTPQYAQDLGLNPKTTYLSIINDLNVKNLRLSAYWDEIEPEKDKYDFSGLDWYVDEAKKHHANIILAIGFKLPRWPECRAPSWLKNPNQLRENELKMLQKTISHYDNNPTITSYQLENEPLLDFGICPPVDRDFLKKESGFVKELTHKPIIITDTGELRFWRTPMQLSDIFGTTLYRTVQTDWFGTFAYPLRPWYYRLKSDLIRGIFAQNNQKTIISELQAEAWALQPLNQIPVSIQIDRFSINRFKETVEFSQKIGFDEVYLWGVEWWYYMANQNHPEYLDYAKSLF